MSALPRTNECGARAVLVTGASTGIGRASALELDRRGWRVFAGVRREGDGRRLVEEAAGPLRPLMLDVTDAAEIAAAAETMAGQLGEAGLAGLVNNAGICVAGPLEVLPVDELRRQLEVNLLGQVAVAQACLPLLRRGRGRIVNLSSVGGRVAMPYLGPYCASKFALEALSDALRLELRTWGIHVALVEPGSVDTPIWRKSHSEADRLEAEAGEAALAPYAADVAAVRRVTEREAAGAMPVGRVVRAVVHALESRRPRARYPVGLSGRMAVFLLTRLPTRLRDWLVLRSLGMR